MPRYKSPLAPPPAASATELSAWTARSLLIPSFRKATVTGSGCPDVLADEGLPLVGPELKPASACTSRTPSPSASSGGSTKPFRWRRPSLIVW